MRWAFEATVRDGLRAPGLRLLLAAVVVIGVALPRIPMPGASLHDHRHLSAEIIWSTLMLAVGVSSLAAGAYAAQRDHSRGYTAEWASSPASASSYASGRVLGAAMLAFIAGVVLSVSVLLFQWIADISAVPSDAALVLPFLAALQAAAHAAFGLALGCLLPVEAALLVGLLASWTCRLGGDDFAWVRVCIPDPAGPWSGRRVALTGLPSALEATWGISAWLAVAAAWTLASAAGLKRRHPATT
ncbi:MAG: hypothetical protein HMLKMBBP_01593 [Planctomycetes bacterium]|nr:hypothetical protein [Planctomycetota bacterium]